MLEKNIVIDLDKTIGYFDQFSYICRLIESYENKGKNNKNIQSNILNELNYIFRPKIIDILSTIINFRNKKLIENFILYTNNTNKLLISLIITKLQSTLNTKKRLFDYVIVCKSKKKSLDDILRKTNIEFNKFTYHEDYKSICVIDDKRHKNLLIDNVFYIHCEPYIFEYSQNEIYSIVDKYLNISISDFLHDYNKKYKLYKNKILSEKNQTEISNRILYYINMFILKAPIV